MPSSLTLTPTTELLEHLDQVLGPSCVAWARDLIAHARRARLREQAHELELCARACRLDPEAVSREQIARSFTRFELGELMLAANEHAPPGFVAHVCELAWSASGDADCAERAVDAYTRLAARLSSTPKHAAVVARALVRAAALARGRTCAASTRLAQVATRLLEQSSQAGDVPLVQRCLETLEALGSGDPEALAALAIACAEREVAGQRDHRACALYGVAARLLARGSRPEEAQVLGTVRASVIAHVARRRRARGEPVWIANSFLRMALEDLGAQHIAPEFRARIERELHGADDQRGDAAVARAMHALAEELDFIAPDQWLAHVGGLPLEPTQRERARPRWLEAVFAHAGDARGWVAAAGVCGASVLEIARGRLAADPAATRAALGASLRRSPWVESEREALWRRGLLACIEGDPLLGLALVVPQIDHALRASHDAVGSRLVGRLDDGLELAARLLLHDRSGLALCEQLASGALAPRDYSQENANLVAWLALRLLALDGGEVRARDSSAP